MNIKPFFLDTLLQIKFFDAQDFTAISFIIVWYLFIVATFFFALQYVRSKHPSSSSMLFAGMASLVGTIQYYFLQNLYFSEATFEIYFRYPGWLIIFPLLLAQLYMVVRPYAKGPGFLIRMVVYTIFMVVMKYLGTTIFAHNNISFGFLAAAGYVGIFYELWFGAAPHAIREGSVILRKGYYRIKWLFTFGWGFYLFCFLFEPGNYLAEYNIPLQLLLNLGDLINICGWGLIIFVLLKEEREAGLPSF